MSRGDLGKWAEKQTQIWLDETSNRVASFAYHRFPDARAARGALAAQPSDYLICHLNGSLQPRTVFLEIKETVQTVRLPKAKIGQYGKLKMFHGAGANVFVVCYRSTVADWTVLTGSDLFSHPECPPSFKFSGVSFATVAAALRHMVFPGI